MVWIKFEKENLFQGGFGGISEAPPENLFSLTQVHGDRIHCLRFPEELSPAGKIEGDAILCKLPGTPVGIRVADCVPLLLHHPRGVVGAIHAGWRGTLRKILPKTLQVLHSEFQASPEEVTLAIGPAISMEAYEVGAEVAGPFERWMPRFLKPKGAKFLLDLKGINREMALEAGVPAEKIRLHPQCTFQDENFYSHRKSLQGGLPRDGRNFAWIKLLTHSRR